MADNLHLPRLVVVTGRPGSGKSTLAQSLSAKISCPLLSRDQLKEGHVHTLGDAPVGDAAKQVVFDAFFDTIELFLRRRITLIAEAAFQHKVWGSKLNSLRDLARIRVIVCSVEPELAQRRWNDRVKADPARRRFHGETVSPGEGQRANPTPYDPPHLDVPTLVVDTTAGYQPLIEVIAKFALQ